MCIWGSMETLLIQDVWTRYVSKVMRLILQATHKNQSHYLLIGFMCSNQKASSSW